MTTITTVIKINDTDINKTLKMKIMKTSQAFTTTVILAMPTEDGNKNDSAQQRAASQ